MYEPRFARPTRGRRRLVLLGMFTAVAGGAAIALAVSAQGAAFAAEASVQPGYDFLNDSAGTDFTFTVHNTGTSTSIGAVEIGSPGKSWTITGCPLAPAGWDAQQAGAKCRYRSASSTSDDIAPGASSSQFQVRVTTPSGTSNRSGTWSMVVSKSNNFDKPSLANVSPFGTGLGITTHTWEVTDAVLSTTTQAAGSVCPAANKTAVTGSTGHVIVICGRNHASTALTPTAAQSSLSGTFIGSSGSFTSGSIPANSGNVVIGNWSNVSVTSVFGPGKTVVARIGSAANQTSPLTTLTGYETTNRPPTAVDDNSYTTDEDTLLTVSAPGVLGNDSDPDGDALTAVLVTGPTHGVLTLNSNGSFSYTPGANYNGSDSFTYRASDGITTSDPAAVTITITGVNDAPIANVPSAQSTGEDQAIVFSPTTSNGVSVTDVDAGTGSVSVDLQVAHGTLLVSGTTGLTPASLPAAAHLTFSGTVTDVNAALDGMTYQPGANYAGGDTLTFTVNDNGNSGSGGAKSDTETVAITVNSANDAPTFTLPVSPNQSVNEDAGAQTVTGFATSISAGPANESAQTLTFHVSNDNTGLFSSPPTLSTSTGTLTYTPAANANGSATVSVYLTDNGGTANGGSDTSSTQTFTITVTAVNDMPSFALPASPNQSVNEDAGAQTVTGFATSISAGPANESAQTATFHVSNNNNALFSSQPSINATTGDLTYTPAAGANGSGTVSVYLTDNGGTANGGSDTSGTQTFTITIGVVNDAPSFTLPASPNQTVNEDAAAQTVTSFATSISAGPSDESAQILTFHVSNNNNGLFGTQPAIDPTTGNLTYTPAANANGSATVSVYLTDNGGTANGGSDTSGTQTFTITVTAVNDAPSFVLPASPNQTANENSAAQTVTGFATSISAGPADESAQTVTFHVSNDNNILFSTQPDIDETTGDLTYTPAADTTGTATVSVYLSDTGGTANSGSDTSGTQTFTITVQPPNSPATDITLTPNSIAENNLANATVGTLASNDPDPGDTFTYTFVTGSGDTDNGAFTISGDQLLVNSPLNYEAKSSYSIRVQVADDHGHTFSTSLTVSVTDVNEPPTAISPATLSIDENSGVNAVVGSLSTTDPDVGDSFTYTFATGDGDTDNGSFTLTAGGQLSANASLDFEAKNAYSILVRSTDSGSLSVDQQVSVLVDNVNETPTDVAVSPSSIDENQPIGTGVGSLSTTDPDVEQAHTYTLEGSGCAGSFPDNAAFTIGTGDVLNTAAVFNYEAKSSYTICVRTTDGGSPALSFDKQIVVTVNDVNDPPTDIQLSQNQIAENQASGTSIGDLTTTDPDTAQTHTYTLLSSGCAGSFPDTASFSISGGTVKSAVSFNYEVKNSYTICVRSTDSGTPAMTFDKQFTVIITDANDAPVATSDSYSGAIGNTLATVQTTVTGAHVALTGSVLVNNDTDEDTGTFQHALSAVAGTVSSTGGGSAQINSDGSFTFVPGVGDKNQNDTFTYQVTDGTATSSGTVTVHIDNFLVWYVDSLASAGGDGRSTAPFTGLSSLNGAGGSGDSDGPGDIIFLFRGSAAAYGGGIPLEANQSLIGQSNGLTVNGHALVTAGSGPALITNAGGVGVNLANGTDIEGITVQNTSGDGVNGVGVTTATVGTTTAVSITGAGGDGVDLSGAAGGNISIAASISSNTGRAAAVANRSSGAVAFSGAITGAGNGIALSSNTGAIINFTGGLSMSTGGNNAFVATGGGTVNVTGTNTLTTSTGTALDVESTTIGASGLTFQSITANGGAHGIVLVSTGSTAGLTVTGTGSAGSGGSLTGMTGADGGTNACAGSGSPLAGVGIYLSSTKSPSFSWMNFPGTFGNFGILGFSVQGFTLDHATMTGTYGANVDQDEDTVHFCTLTGSATISNSTISNGAETNLRVVNGSGTLNRLTLQSDTFGLNQNLGGDGVLLEADAGTFNATVLDSTFQGSRGSPFQALPQAGAVMDLDFGSPGHGNTIHNTHSNIVPFAWDFAATPGGTMTFDIDSNHFDVAGSTTNPQGGVFINAANSTATATGYFRNNTIGNSGVANSGSGSQQSALQVESNDGGNMTAVISGNTIVQFNGALGTAGVYLEPHGATTAATVPTVFNVTMTNNSVSQQGTANPGNAIQGVQLNNETTTGTIAGGEAFSTCLKFEGNTVAGAGAGGAGGDVRLRQRFNTKVLLPGYTGAADGSGVQTFLQTPRNVGTPTVTVATSTAGGGGFFNTAGGAACTLPSF